MHYQAPVAHTYNPSYSGGRDQEDHGSKPVRANSSQHYLEKILHTHKKKVGRVAQGISPEFKPQYLKQTKN
jgi:hypothetical protein